MEENVDSVHKNDLVWGLGFHEWVVLRTNEPKNHIVEDFLRYSKSVGEEMYTYFD